MSGSPLQPPYLFSLQLIAWILRHPTLMTSYQDIKPRENPAINFNTFTG